MSNNKHGSAPEAAATIEPERPENSERSHEPRHTSAYWINLVILLLFLLIGWFKLPFVIGGDGQDRFNQLQTTLTTGQMPPGKYSLIGPLCSAPLWFLGSRLGNIQFWVERYNLILFGIFSLICVRFLPSDDRTAVRCLRLCNFLALGSMLGYSLKEYYTEVYSSLTFGVAVALVVCRVPRAAVVACALIPLSVCNTPGTAVAAGLACLFLGLREKRLYLLALPALGILLAMGEDGLRHPGPLHGYPDDRGFRTVMPYSGRPGFCYPFVLGCLNLLFSFGKGLLFFAPSLFVFPWVRRNLDERWRCLLDAWFFYILGLLLVYSRWWAWYGGVFWGPRFLLFATLPAALILARLSEKEDSSTPPGLATLLIVGSLWVGICGIAFGQVNQDIGIRNNYALEHLLWHVPEFSVLVTPVLQRGGIWPGLQHQFLLVLLALALGWESTRSDLGRLIRSSAGLPGRAKAAIRGPWRW